MTSVLDLDNHTRLLIVVPHPDDETLATGGLIQAAIAVGASLRVVIVTDGDNNPWPQRWVEKRWHIDAEARKRWGSRRREEAIAALEKLGVAKTDVRHYSWPDQGLTALLMRDAQCEDRLATEVDDFAPNLIVAPSLNDRHPDHNALRVMLELAIARSAFAQCRRLGFIVHGSTTHRESLTVSAPDDHVRKKQLALQAHTSQLVLSGKRMSEICQRIERFECSDAPAIRSADSAHQEWRIVDSRHPMALRACALYLIVRLGNQIIRAAVPLPRSSEYSMVTLAPDGLNLLKIKIAKSRDELCVELEAEHGIDQIFAKIERLGSRLFIYDARGWLLIR